MELLLIIGLATGFNLLIIVYTFSLGRIAEATLDMILFILIVYIMSDSGQGGLFVGMVASAIVSMAILISPPKFLQG